MRILLHQWLYRWPYLWLEVGFSRNRLASHILSLATMSSFSDYLQPVSHLLSELVFFDSNSYRKRRRQARKHTTSRHKLHLRRWWPSGLLLRWLVKITWVRCITKHSIGHRPHPTYCPTSSVMLYLRSRSLLFSLQSPSFFGMDHAWSHPVNTPLSGSMFLSWYGWFLILGLLFDNDMLLDHRLRILERS